MTLWRLLITPPARGAWNMAVDESILEHIGRGASLPTLRLGGRHAASRAGVELNV